MARMAFGGTGGNGLVPEVPDVILPGTELEADGDSLVCEMTGTGNEIAAGVLTGADLVLTMNGTIGAAVDGFRQIPTGGGGFLVTLNFYNAFFLGDEYSILHRVKGINLTGNCYMMYLGGNVANSPRIINIGYDVYGGMPEVSETTGYGGGPPPYFRTTAPMLNEETVDGWLFRGRNRNVFYAGFKEGDELPKNMFDSTLGYGVVKASQKPAYSPLGAFGTYNAIAGINSTFNNPGTWKQGTIVVSKKALGVPPEWLV